MNVKKTTPFLAFTAFAFVFGLAFTPMVNPATVTLAMMPGTMTPAPEGKDTVPPGDIAPAAPATGNKVILVILIQFTDKVHGTGKTPSFYQDLLFNKANALSMASYYWENSYGRLNLTGYVTNWYTSSQAMNYYGADSGDFPNIDDANGNIFELPREAVQLADPTVNYANFDKNSDGFIDHLIIIHAGLGQEASSDTDNIWSHQWDITPAETTGDSSKKARAYGLFAEDSQVGVISHEFGHVLGLPDMYDYTYSGQEFVGNYALMGSGSWNGEPAGSQPSHLISWSKMQLGFINSSEREDVGINVIKNVTIIPTSRQALPAGEKRVAIINISAGIYYTVEVRDKSLAIGGQFDSALPDRGVLVTLCNDSATDEIFYGRPGVCVVQNAHPSDTTKDQAPFDLGVGEDARFDDPQRNIVVEVLARNETTGAYTVRLSHQQLEMTWFYVNGSANWQTFKDRPFTLTITLRNTGSTSLLAVSGTLSTTTALVTVNAPATKLFGTIVAGASVNNTSSFSVTVGNVVGTPMNFSLSVTWTGATTPSLFSIEIPVQQEPTPPSVSFSRPATNVTQYQASEDISLIASVSDNVEIFKAWSRTFYQNGTALTGWHEMSLNNTHASGVTSIKPLGNFTIVLRVMDTSGNTMHDAVEVKIIDNIRPDLLLSVNLDTGNPSHFTVLGTTLDIVAVVIDNNEVVEVELSINGGTFFSILGYPALVNMGVNGSLDGYAYSWTPSIEGRQLIRLRGTDASNNSATIEWQITTISMQTIYYIVFIIIGIVAVFAAISSATRRTHRRNRSRYYYRY